MGERDRHDEPADEARERPKDGARSAPPGDKSVPLTPEHLLKELQAAGSEFKALEARLAGVQDELKGLTAAHRLPVGYRAWAWVGAVITVVVGLAFLGTAAVVVRSFNAIRLAELDAQLTETRAKLDKFQEIAESARSVAQELRVAKLEYQAAQKAAGDAATRLNEVSAGLSKVPNRLDEILAEARKSTQAVETKLNAIGGELAGKVGTYVETSYINPGEKTKTALDDLGSQVTTLRTMLRGQATPERTAVVLFDSEALKAETCKGPLQALFRETPLRSGYEGYQLALYFASNGRLKRDQPLIPFGDGPVPAVPFNAPWGTEPGSTDKVTDFDPAAVFTAVPDGVARRLVLLVSPSAAAPNGGDARWPGNLKVSALVVGAADKERLKGWASFCKEHKGSAREVVPGSPLLDALKGLTEPDKLKPIGKL